MEKVRFGERSGQYIQEIDMQELIIKCDICLKPIKGNNNNYDNTKQEKHHLDASLSSGKREDGPTLTKFIWKDICYDCSFSLTETLREFKNKREKVSE